MAAIAGFTRLLAAACRICAPRTAGKIGHSAIASALALIPIIANAARRRSDRTASTAAPPAPAPSGTQSPQVDHLATWTALKDRNDGGYSAGMYYNKNTAAIIAAQNARG